MAEANENVHDTPLCNPAADIQGDELRDQPAPLDYLSPFDEESFSSLKEKEWNSQIEALRSKFQELRERLDNKEKLIFDGLEKDISDNEKENLTKQLTNFYKTKRNLEEDMKDTKLAHIFSSPYNSIVQQISRNEKMLRGGKFVRWNISECEKAIDNVCIICEGKDIVNRYKSKKGILWESVEPGTDRTQVNAPAGLTVEPKTDRIVIADPENNRIQVFNNQGGHLFEIPLVLNKVVFFSFLGESLFIIALRKEQFLITKMESLGGTTNCKTLIKLDKCYNDFFTKPDMSSLFLFDMKRNSDVTLTICVYKNNHKLLTRCISADSLEERTPDGDIQVELHSPYIKDHTVATCVRVVGLTHLLTNFYVLFQNSPYAVQVFNWRGEIVRNIIDKINLGNVRSLFLVDQEEHIIICTIKRTFDDKHNKDKQPNEFVVQNLYSNYVFTDDGIRQHKWTYKTTNRHSVFQSLRKPFQRRNSMGARVPNVVGAAPYFGACLNSSQELLVLHAPEHAFLLRAF